MNEKEMWWLTCLNKTNKNNNNQIETIKTIKGLRRKGFIIYFLLFGLMVEISIGITFNSL